MKNLYFLLSICVVFLLAGCKGNGERHAIIETNHGNIRVMLYPETPQHTNNFIKLVDEGFYDELLFHRVKPNFMIQGGDPNSKGSPAGTPLGMGGTGYTIPSEKGLPHLRGTLAAAKKGNEVESSGCQFYITVGNPVTDAQLDATERRHNVKYSDAQRNLYKQVGGTPHLDMVHTVFGEVVEGMDVVDKIANLPRNGSDRPNEDVVMKIRMD